MAEVEAVLAEFPAETVEEGVKAAATKRAQGVPKLTQKKRQKVLLVHLHI